MLPAFADLNHRVQRLLDKLVADGAEDAMQAAIYLDGRLVVDAWAAPTGRTIDGDTRFPIWSTTKGLAATAINRLVERGVLDWDAPLARWWPEFAANGKDRITLRHALAHTAGMEVLPTRSDMGGIADWEAMCQSLAAAAPTCAPGERQSYHAITYGWLIGETARRAVGRDFASICYDEVCAPLGLPSFFWQGDVPVVELDEPPVPADPGAVNPAIPPWVLPLERLINRDDVRRACLPASNGITSARALAKHYAGLVGDGVEGVRLLSVETVRHATDRAACAPRDPNGAGPRGLGYGLSGPGEDPGQVFGHGGYGGSSAFADTRLRMGFGFTRRRMIGSPDTVGLIKAELLAAVG